MHPYTYYFHIVIYLQRWWTIVMEVSQPACACTSPFVFQTIVHNPTVLRLGKTSGLVSGFGSESFMVAERSTGIALAPRRLSNWGRPPHLTVGQNLAPPNLPLRVTVVPAAPLNPQARRNSPDLVHKIQ